MILIFEPLDLKRSHVCIGINRKWIFLYGRQPLVKLVVETILSGLLELEYKDEDSA